MDNDLFICIDHVGLAVPDLDEAVKFHTEVFGWRELHREVPAGPLIFAPSLSPKAKGRVGEG